MDDKIIDLQGSVCPLPLQHKQYIVMGHGSGGKMSHDLISSLFLPPFDNPALQAGDDSGVAQFSDGKRIAISTDSHVVSPLFFPGGDIGRLAVCGTVNDVAMMGARPLYLTAGFILEEGLDIEKLERIVASMQNAAIEASIEIVAGDTKVVQRGKADGVYINTSGVGILPAGLNIGGAQAKPGDIVIVSGTIGDHGIAVLQARGELGFDSGITSDIAPLNHLVAAMLESKFATSTSSPIHVLRDPTRGGLATTLNEIARQSQVGIIIDEQSIPVQPAVAAACEMLGFDPLYVANEGKLVAIVSSHEAETILKGMHAEKYGEDAAIIGEVVEAPKERLLVKTPLGTTRIADVLAGEMLPRIC
jgi:hydrogenase expression/formation protein HypE